MMGCPSRVRHDEAEAVEGMADGRTAIGERHRRRGGVRDSFEQERERWIDVAEETRGLMRFAGEDDRVGVENITVLRRHAPAAFGPRHGGHAGLEPDRPRREAGAQGAHQLLHALGEGDEERPAGAARTRGLGGRRTRAAPQGQDHAALAPLHLREARHGGGERQVVRVGGVDAGDEGLRHPLERLAAEATAHECAEALVGFAAAGQHEVERHPELARPGEQTRGHEGTQARGCEELKALRQRMERAAPDYEGAAKAIVGPHQPVFQAEPAAERERPRLLRQERVGTAFDEKVVAALGRDGAAEAIARLEHREVERPVLARPPAPPPDARPRAR